VSDAAEPLATLRAGGKAALARALARIESEPRAAATVALLEAAWAAPRGWAIGLTGPPGVGKSTLASALLRGWRARDLAVAMLAVDPSSRRTGGALLGDRTRLVLDPDDPQLFVRSLAARDRLGGTAALCFPALVLLRALFDRVLVETVGVGQSETDIAELADRVLLAVQPASGDTVQFLKAGIAEIPDLAVVTKADLGQPAARTARELEAALALAAPGRVPVLLVSAATGEGVEALLEALEGAATGGPDLVERRRAQARYWLAAELREALARRALAGLDGGLDAAAARPFQGLSALLAAAERR
jgi:LAO/AO transport system kinase